jgi:hypothetical protein
MALAAGVTAAFTVWVADFAAGWAAGILAALLLTLLPAIVNVHVDVLSEPLFLALISIMLALMVRQPRRALAYGTVAALATMVRYAGLSLVAAAGIWAFLQGGTRAERLRRTILAALPAAVLLGAWVVRLSAEHETMRHVGLFLGLTANLHQLGTAVADQLAPTIESPRYRLALAALAGALLVALLLGGVRRARAGALDGIQRRLYAALGIIAACYVAELVLARLLADRGIPFDGRLLAPLLLLAAIGAAVALGSGWPVWGVAKRAAAAAGIVAWVAGATSVLVDEYADLREHGTGYMHEELRNSAVGRWLRSDGRPFALFTNNPVIVYFDTGRPSRELPSALTDQSLQEFRDIVRQYHGVIVGFRISFRATVAPDTLAARLGLVPLVQSPEGTVWGWREAP